MKLPYYLKVTDDVKYADSKMCRIRINPDYENHEGLMAHEYEHVKQWYAFLAPFLIAAIVCWFTYSDSIAIALAFFSLLAKGLAYTFIKGVRFELEARAYRKQLEVQGPQNLEVFAKALAEGYGLGITIEKAREKIKG